MRAADAEQYRALLAEALDCFSAKKYDEAAQKCKALVELSPEDANAHYNLACAWARLGKAADAFASLGKSIELGYRDPAHMKSDEDLASLREDKRFAELAEKARKGEREGKYERGGEIPGLKTVEDFPEGGLRYRLRMDPAATAEKPQRLVVWLHPSGGSANQAVESLAPRLAKLGFALVVFTQKDFNGWSEEDAKKLVDHTLPELAKVPGVDAAKPLLLGYSAGGQMALELWREKPGRWGGLILDAAYPLDTEKYMRGEVVPIPLPKDEGLKTAPFFVLVGEQDGGSKLWQKVEDEWRKGGVSLAIHLVPGKGHTWLFGKAQVEDLAQWLSQTAAAKPPVPAESKPEAAPQP